jgi:hypothetical protein
MLTQTARRNKIARNEIWPRNKPSEILQIAGLTNLAPARHETYFHKLRADG